MLGFFIKKSFFDGWDNFLSLLLLNLGYIVCILGGLAVFSYLGENFWLSFSLIAVLIVVACIYTGGVTGMTQQYVNYKREGWACFKKSLVHQLPHSLLFALVVGIMILCATVVIPFYAAAIQGLFGLVLAMIVVWVMLFCTLALMYYFPLANMMEDDPPLKTLKKCFIILGDNFWFSIFFLVYSIINLVLSVLLAFMIPGICGIHLSQAVAMKIIMFKYDYLEDNPALDAKQRKHMNWDDLLYEEREKVGNRTLKGMIFPWKD